MTEEGENGKVPVKELYFALGEGSFIPQEVAYYSDNFQAQGDSLDPWREQVAKEVESFTDWTPRFLQERLFYIPYCQKNDLMEERTVRSSLPGGSFKVLKPKIPFLEQTDESLFGSLEWQDFLSDYQPPRDELIKSVYAVVDTLPKRDTRYTDLWDVKQFDRSMKMGGYKIALKLIPGITDEEVKEIFGRGASLDSIKEAVSESEN